MKDGDNLEKVEAMYNIQKAIEVLEATIIKNRGNRYNDTRFKRVTENISL